MNFGLNKFSEAAKNFSHNPLGIIALFIWLVYAIAALVMMYSINSLLPHESVMLLSFIILFPFVILFVFYKLVTKHHNKLYAPKDYRTDDAFYKCASIEEQRKQRESEIEEEQQELKQEEKGFESKHAVVKTAEGIREKYFLAENLIIRVLEAEMKVSIKRACRLGPEKGSPIIDGIFFENDQLNIIEIKLITAPRFALIGISKFLSQLTSYYVGLKEKNVFPRKMSVLLAVVVDEMPDQRLLKLRIERVVDKYPNIKVDVKLFDFKELKQKFGIE